MFNSIDWKIWDFSNGDLTNGSLESQVVFHRDALLSVRRLSKEELAKLVRTQLQAKFDEGYRCLAPTSMTEPSQNTIDCFSADMNEIIDGLMLITNPNVDIEIRYKKFLVLADNLIFKLIGPRLLFELIPDSQLQSAVGYKLVLSASKSPTISATYGNLAQDELYKAALYTQNVINNRSYDPRLYMDDDGRIRIGKIQ